MSNEKKQEDKQEVKKELPMRQIVIETDGNIAKIIKADVAGILELKAILKGLLENIK